MSPRMIELLQRFDVECVDALEVQRHHPRRAVGGWEAKPYAILHSPFKEVVFLDADNVPLIDPATLLSCAEYRATGAIFWPDLRSLAREHPIWEICRVAYRDEPEFETGQIVIDKERSWKALHLTLHLNEQSDFYYQHVQGDKETFHMAWRMLDQPYSMPAMRPAWAVGLISPGDPYFADVLQQHDFDGRIVFHHRTGAKWTAWGRNFRVPGFEHQAICLNALEELRQQWDGRVDVPRVVARAPTPEAELLRSRYFLYRRIGSDERVLSFLPGQRVGDGGTQWEQMWRLEEEQGRQSLVIEGRAGVTSTLLRDPDGVWRGRWLHQEQMPVELIPLGNVCS
jgi:Mannosyltransferase putative